MSKASKKRSKEKMSSRRCRKNEIKNNVVTEWCEVKNNGVTEW